LVLKKGGKKIMSQDMYGLCCRYEGKVVRINEHGGRVHMGRITRVSPNRVYIQPMGPRGGLGGYGYGFGGYGGYGGFGGYGGYGYGGYGIALGAIAGIALAGLFFW
jgi:hypothetical protein